ncbi:PorT family protein [Adhaeribacter sp. BT258]|uniref:PorT family protein n=1 Tax=Adhaeribacter terrigena TaxID=2793070 RepID=A0ABS1BWA8_9BACT|nr:outer membrane beta-barrel protein [Adhaeribacter terrigena]MBK0401381.1 PorT family protein [Adhaeribacter terrigena]
MAISVKILACCLLLTGFAEKAEAQKVALGVAAGYSFNYAYVKQVPDPVEAYEIAPKVARGLVTAFQAALPLQNGFSLQAGIRFMAKALTFEQTFSYPGNSVFKTEWRQKGFGIETPVHLAYTLLNRRHQLIISSGFSLGRNWISSTYYGYSYKSGSIFSGGVSSGSGTDHSIASTFIPAKNSMLLGAEIGAELRPFFHENIALSVLFHQELLREFGSVRYENKFHYVQNQSNAIATPKGSFEVIRPAYFMVQVEYTLNGKKIKHKPVPEIKQDFEEDGSE